MDLRLWVLVTDFDPLTVWLFDEFWIRLAMQDYEHDSLDPKKALTNASIPRRLFQAVGGTEWVK